MGRRPVKVTDSVKKNVWLLVAAIGMIRSHVPIIIAGHLLARSHALKPGQFGVKRKRTGEMRTKIMVIEIRKTEMKETTNKTKRKGTKMKNMKNMNQIEMKEIMKGDVIKENKETMNMTKKILETVLGRVAKEEGNKTKLTKTDPKKMKNLIGKEEMNIGMNILKMKKKAEISKDKTKEGEIGRIQMVKREVEKEISKGKNKERGIGKMMIIVKRRTEKEINMITKEDKIIEEIKINQSMTLAMIDTKVQWMMIMMTMAK
jgi:hypothetical protein